MIDNEFFLSLNFHKSGLIKFKSRIRWFPNTHDTCPVHVLEPGKVVLLVSCLRNRNDIQLGRSVYEKYEIWGEQIELFAVPSHEVEDVSGTTSTELSPVDVESCYILSILVDGYLIWASAYKDEIDLVKDDGCSDE